MNTHVFIYLEDIELKVTGYVHPEEHQTRDHPGASAFFEVESVTVVDPAADILDLILSDFTLEQIEDKALEKHWADMAANYEGI